MGGETNKLGLTAGGGKVAKSTQTHGTRTTNLREFLRGEKKKTSGRS